MAPGELLSPSPQFVALQKARLSSPMLQILAAAVNRLRQSGGVDPPVHAPIPASPPQDPSQQAGGLALGESPFHHPLLEAPDNSSQELYQGAGCQGWLFTLLGAGAGDEGALLLHRPSPPVPLDSSQQVAGVVVVVVGREGHGAAESHQLVGGWSYRKGLLQQPRGRCAGAPLACWHWPAQLPPPPWSSECLFSSFLLL